MIDNCSVYVIQDSCTSGAKFCDMPYIIIYFVCTKYIALFLNYCVYIFYIFTYVVRHQWQGYFTSIAFSMQCWLTMS